MTQTLETPVNAIDPSSPLGLFLDALEKPRYWQVYGALRNSIDDPQILGCGYCIAGVLCDLFIKHAPEAKDIKARWEGTKFLWEDGAGNHEEWVQLPAPVVSWWTRHHSHVGIVNKNAIMGNDRRMMRFEDFALFLRALYQDIKALDLPVSLKDSKGVKHELR